MVPMWYEILALVGIPSIVTALLNWLERKAIRKETAKARAEDKTDALALGVQALLRAQMIADFNHYSEKGWAPVYARDNFENCWKQYEALGANGVLKDLHDDFMALPKVEPKHATVTPAVVEAPETVYTSAPPRRPRTKKAAAEAAG